VRLIVADDAVIIRQGLARLLGDHGMTVVAEVGTAEELLDATARERPDAAVVDIRMPPTFTDEGIRAAHHIRARHPGVGVLLLSQYVDVAYATRLVGGESAGLGYLLKDRIVDMPTLIESLRRIAAGETVIEPALVQELVQAPTLQDPLAELTPREREILGLMAEGRTDRGIGEALFLSQKTVESHVRSIFRKLDLPATPSDNRRVHAVLTFLRRPETQAS
jgi:DNA-binding NarL/FixJ family response regulator